MENATQKKMQEDAEWQRFILNARNRLPYTHNSIGQCHKERCESYAQAFQQATKDQLDRLRQAKK